MSNDNFAIPGLQTPEPEFHLARAKTIPAGAFLMLTDWDKDLRIPTVLLLYAGMPDDTIFTIEPRRISTYAKGGKKRLGIWLPDNMAVGDWVAETSINGQIYTRTLFSIGKASPWEVPATGRLSEDSLTDSSGNLIDVGVDTIWKGSSWFRRLTITDLNGAAVDLANYGAWSQLRSSPGGTLLATMTVTFVEGLAGVLDIELSAAVTDILATGWAWWDVLLQRPDQTYDRTLPVRVFIGTGVTENG